MRLHRLSVQNLASLRSDTPIVIDFDEGLRGAPLFAIVGPTGAGKSTLLDAIQLALFGSTARLAIGLTSSKTPEDLGANDTRQLISRGARSAQVELEFGLVDPQGVPRRYRAIWSCRLPKTNFEAPRRTLSEYDAETGTWGRERGGAQLQDYKELFSETLGGMTVDEFNRTILLAQGQFAALLHAPEDKRVALLEKVTQTGNYRDIGARAAQRHRVAKGAYDQARAVLGSLDTPPPEREHDLRAGIGALTDHIGECETRIARLAGWIAWLERRDVLATNVARAQDEVVAAASRRNAHADELLRLRHADHVAEALAAMDRLVGLQRALLELAQQVAVAQGERDALADRTHAAIEAASEAEGQLAHLTKARDDAAPEIEAAEQAWSTTAECDTRWRNSAREADGASTELQTATTAAAVSEAEVTARETNLQKHDAGLAEHAALLETRRAALAALLGDFAAPDEAEAALQHERETAASEARTAADARDGLGAFLKADGEHREHTERIASLADEIAAHEAERVEAHAAAAAADVALTTAGHHLELLRRSRVFVTERLDLQDGDPCPLCGSKEHDVSLFPHDEALLTQMEAAQSAHNAAVAQREACATRIARLDNALTRARTEVTVTEAARLRAAQTRAELTARLDSFSIALGSNATELGHDALTERIALTNERAHRAAARLTALQAARRELTQAAAALSVAGEERNGLLVALAAAVATRDARAAALDAARARVREREAALAAAREALELAQAACAGLLGGRNPRHVREAFQAACEAAATRLKAAGEARLKAESAVTACDATITLLRQQMESRAGEVEVAEAALGLLLDQLGVTREEAEARRLPREERARLEQLAAALDRQEHAAAGALLGARTHATEHAAARPDGLVPEAADATALAAERAAHEVERNAALGQLGASKQALAEVEQLRQRTARYGAELEAAEAELQGWQRIQTVIGTGEGTAFARFAQSLGLEELLWRANEQLAFLNPRYSFVRAGGSLDFGVKDHHQLDGIRPLSTLSGGETFLCSLALALGLARWRVSSIPIETLLLDEGFGTLDAETLGVAMSALQRLCSGGNMRVGVVTHVEAMRERIDARIVVEKLHGGRSTVRVETGLRG